MGYLLHASTGSIQLGQDGVDLVLKKMRPKIYNNMMHVEEINPGEFLITNTKGDHIAECEDYETAAHLVKLHNEDLTRRRGF
jgi:hypothetical protein